MTTSLKSALAAAATLALVSTPFTGPTFAQQRSERATSKLALPASGPIPVAFVLTESSVMIDFAGPWEVFQDVMIPSRGPKMADQHIFHLYTVSDTKQPIHTSGGMQITPDYTFDDAPQPKIVVVPAQMGGSAKMKQWLQHTATTSDVVMSVCTGAFQLADAGLLNGKPATTHHMSLDRLQGKYPAINVQRGLRYVQSDPVIFTAGGLTSGIDLALHIVDLYAGREIATATATYMEYESDGWKEGRAMTATASQR